MIKDRLTNCFSSLVIVVLLYLDGIDCLSCFKCMTNDVNNDTCADPFNPIDNHLESDCQATVFGRNGLFPARFCVKISGTIVDVDRDVNRSLLEKSLFLRTCIADNILDSTRSSDSTGNFYLKNFDQIKGVRMQGTISLCAIDGCNRTNSLRIDCSFVVSLLLLIYSLK